MGNFCPLSAGSAVQRARVHTPSGLRGIEPPTHAIFQVRCPLCKGLSSRSISSCLVGHLCGNTSPGAAHKPSRASVPAPKPRGTQESTSVRWLPEGQVSSHVWPVMTALTLWAPGREGWACRGGRIGRQGFRGGRIQPSSPWWLLSQACPRGHGMQVCAQHLLSPWLSSWQKGDFLHVSPLIFFCTFQTCKQAERTAKSAPTTFHLDSAVVSSGPRHSPTT